MVDKRKALSIAIYALMYWADPSGEDPPPPDFDLDDVDVAMAVVELTEMRYALEDGA